MYIDMIFFFSEKQKLALWSTFKNFEEMTCVYFEDFLPEDIGKNFAIINIT